DAPKGTVIAYSTAPGEVADDGTGRDSPYTTALAAAMRQDHEPVEQVFKHVRISVLDSTKGKQTPWESSSLTGDFYFSNATAKDAVKSDATEKSTLPAPPKSVPNAKQPAPAPVASAISQPAPPAPAPDAAPAAAPGTSSGGSAAKAIMQALPGIA